MRLGSQAQLASFGTLPYARRHGWTPKYTDIDLIDFICHIKKMLACNILLFGRTWERCVYSKGV